MSNVIQRLRVFRQDYCGRWQHQEKKKKKKTSIFHHIIFLKMYLINYILVFRGKKKVTNTDTIIHY